MTRGRDDAAASSKPRGGVVATHDVLLLFRGNLAFGGLAFGGLAFGGLAMGGGCGFARGFDAAGCAPAGTADDVVLV